ncbi:unnamed protein product, partial [Meganyctiphanes norvegica]
MNCMGLLSRDKNDSLPRRGDDDLNNLSHYARADPKPPPDESPHSLLAGRTMAMEIPMQYYLGGGTSPGPGGLCGASPGAREVDMLTQSMEELQATRPPPPPSGPPPGPPPSVCGPSPQPPSLQDMYMESAGGGGGNRDSYSSMQLPPVMTPEDFLRAQSVGLYCYGTMPTKSLLDHHHHHQRQGRDHSHHHNKTMGHRTMDHKKPKKPQVLEVAFPPKVRPPAPPDDLDDDDDEDIRHIPSEDDGHDAGDEDTSYEEEPRFPDDYVYGFYDEVGE